MPSPTDTQTVTINLSGTVSDQFTVLARTSAMIWCPTITSGQVFLRGSFDETSANFLPIYKTDGTSRYTLEFGPGSAMVTLDPDIVAACAFFKIEASVSQAASRFFIVSAKP